MNVLKKLLMLVLIAFLVSSCDLIYEVPTQKPFYSEVDLWAYFETKGEQRIFQEHVNYFNEHQYQIRINAVILPSNVFHNTVKKAAVEKSLPDIIAVNSNYVALYADQEFIIPMDKFLTDSTRNDLLSAVLNKGVFDGRIYMVSPQASGLVLYANKEKLLANEGDAFIYQSEYIKLHNFESLLERLANHDDDGAVMDMSALSNRNWAAQMLLSQLSETSFIPADDMAESPSMERALQLISKWNGEGYIASNDSDALLNGDVALSWSLLADYPKLKRSMGDNLVMIPFPGLFGHDDLFGNVSKYSHPIIKSWGWSVTRQCDDVQVAMHFIEYIFQKQKIIEASRESKLMPATLTALKEIDYFSSQREINFINAENTISLSKTHLIRPEMYSKLQTVFNNVNKGEAISKIE